MFDIRVISECDKFTVPCAAHIAGECLKSVARDAPSASAGRSVDVGVVSVTSPNSARH